MRHQVWCLYSLDIGSGWQQVAVGGTSWQWQWVRQQLAVAVGGTAVESGSGWDTSWQWQWVGHQVWCLYSLRVYPKMLRYLK